MFRIQIRRLTLCGGFLSIGFGLAYLQSPGNKLKHAYEERQPRIAIIGSGIGGTSAAYFTRDLLGPSATIDVFEKSKVVGGRVAVVEVNGKYYEAGASIFHESNQYLKDFIKLSELTKMKCQDLQKGSTGIFDGEQFVFQDSEWKFLTVLKFFWTYGFSVITLNKFLGNTLKEFGNVYRLQDDSKCFTSVSEMLTAIGGHPFVSYSQSTFRALALEKGVATKLLDQFCVAVTRVNYGQDLNINGFVGSVALAGAQSPKLWSVKYGNYQICQRILELTKANVFLQRKVLSIDKVESSKETSAYKLIGEDGQSLGAYDAVIVAAPLEDPRTAIKCTECRSWPSMASGKGYQQTIATFVVGNIRPETFGFKNIEDVPEELFTTESPNVFYNSISVITPVDGPMYDKKTSQRPLVYKVFSREILTDAQLNTLFSDISSTKVVRWLAYPHYSPPEKFDPFVLDDGIFYVNAIERAASAMEMSALSGRNAALLLKKYIDKKLVSKHPGNILGNMKTEL